MGGGYYERVVLPMAQPKAYNNGEENEEKTYEAIILPSI